MGRTPRTKERMNNMARIHGIHHIALKCVGEEIEFFCEM